MIWTSWSGETTRSVGTPGKPDPSLTHSRSCSKHSQGSAATIGKIDPCSLFLPLSVKLNWKGFFLVPLSPDVQRALEKLLQSSHSMKVREQPFTCLGPNSSATAAAGPCCFLALPSGPCNCRQNLQGREKVVEQYDLLAEARSRTEVVLSLESWGPQVTGPGGTE